MTALSLMWAVQDMWQLRPYFASSCAIPLWSHPSCSCRFTCLILPHCLTRRISLHTFVQNRTKLDPQTIRRALGYRHNIKKWHLLDKHFKISLLQKYWVLFLLCAHTSPMSLYTCAARLGTFYGNPRDSSSPVRGYSLFWPFTGILSSKTLPIYLQSCYKKKPHTQQKGEPIWSATH